MTRPVAGPTSGVEQDFLQDITLPADHPAFAGHFPGQPIVPGVVLLDQLLIALAAWLSPARGGEPTPRRSEIASAKFLSPLRPGEPLQLQAVRQPGDGVDTIRFELGSGGRKIATGVVKFHHAPGP